MSMKKKVVFVIPSLRGGGAERIMVNIIRNLDWNKFSPTLVLLNREGPFIELLPVELKVIDLKSPRVRDSFFKLVKVLNKLKPDVVFATLGHLNLALVIIKYFLRKKPKIIIREGNTPSRKWSEMSNFKRRLFTILYRQLYPQADLIIAQCKDMKYDLVNYLGIDHSKIKYIYNPLDVDKIKLDCQKDNPFVHKDRINILSVGRLTYAKGFDVLIDAFKILHEELPNIHLTILGEGKLKCTLEKRAEALNIGRNISFAGFKSNPYPYFFHSDTYVLSSRWEGFPNTLLEALACKSKVVATDCKSGPREILGDNEYGVLVPPEDCFALAKGILKSINSANKSKRRAYDFDVKVIIKEYEKVIL